MQNVIKTLGAGNGRVFMHMSFCEVSFEGKAVVLRKFLRSSARSFAAQALLLLLYFWAAQRAWEIIMGSSATVA